MTYQPTIPNANDYLAQSQIDIRNNFNLLNTYFGENHIALNAGANNGKHTHANFVEQVGDPATLANEVAVYSKDLGGISTLYLRKESNGTVIRMSAQDPLIAADGSSFLPGGIIIKWGHGNASPAGNVINFASAFPTACWQVVTTPEGGTSRAVAIDATSQNGFTAYATNNCVVRYIAIGN